MRCYQSAYIVPNKRRTTTGCLPYHWEVPVFSRHTWQWNGELTIILKACCINQQIEFFFVSLQQSWTVSIKNYFKNIRKTKRTPGSKATSGPEPPPKKMKKGGQVPSYAEGETESTCKEHMASLKKEMQKNSNRNLQMVKQLMEITYPYRRRMILSEPLSIPEIMDKFPALNLVTEVWLLRVHIYI